MKFSYKNLLESSLLVLYAFYVASLYCVNASDDSIALVDFQGMLFSEINSEIESVLLQESRDDGGPRLHHQGRFLREQDVSQAAQDLWDKVMRHGWDLSLSSNGSSKSINNHRSMQETQYEPTKRVPFPYIVCSHSSGTKSAFQRLQPMLKYTGAYLDDAIVVLNDNKKTCYHVSLEYGRAQSIRDVPATSNGSADDYYTIAPMVDLMKIQFDTLKLIHKDSWAVPSSPNLNDWERTISVGLSSGHRMANEVNVSSIAKKVLHDIRSIGESGTKNRQRRKLLSENSKMTLAGLFSATAGSKPDKEQGEHRYLRQGVLAHLPKKSEEKSRWIRALELGLEADHTCNDMFDSLDVKVHYDKQGFDIILNPRINSKKNHNYGVEIQHERNIHPTEAVKHSGNDRIEEAGTDETERNGDKRNESSASNKNCVVSLIMALSTHPLVLSIESEGPVESSDYQSQWITESRSEIHRPLRDLGINGKGQVISIIDSGLDINHEYFGPTSEKVFREWDHSQRKVVRYDHDSLGDTSEPKGGHGTKVAAVAAGMSYTNSNAEANGVAGGAKLHIYDIQESNGIYNFPSAYDLFESMHSTMSNPARIANGSFMTTYRAYPSSCKYFDDALYGKFQGDLFIASAGNGGFDEVSMESIERTIGNPASCKNTLAVGASQSHGQRLTPGDKGIDYLAAFSSRGPTFDGRMKPDLVAPGSSVLTAYAHEIGRTVEAYGTSLAGPVVAGNAALIRQYFEEGHLPCDFIDCTFDPSGSLIKAVLLNSAQNLKQVQVSLPGTSKKLLEEVSEYDNNQGMGLIQLDKTLPIPGHNKFKAIIKNNAQISDRGIHDIFIMTTPGKCWNKPYKDDFSATLTWYDPPGAISCAKCLVNDLDIMVHGINSHGKVKGGSKVFPNGSTKKDYDNNVERIRFNMKGIKRYRIRIRGANLATKTTTYSMIATGCFKVIPMP